jgi:hypothetical protein
LTQIAILECFGKCPHISHAASTFDIVLRKNQPESEFTIWLSQRLRVVMLRFSTTSVDSVRLVEEAGLLMTLDDSATQAHPIQKSSAEIKRLVAARRLGLSL